MRQGNVCSAQCRSVMLMFPSKMLTLVWSEITGNNCGDDSRIYTREKGVLAQYWLTTGPL